MINFGLKHSNFRFHMGNRNMKATLYQLHLQQVSHLSTNWAFGKVKKSINHYPVKLTKHATSWRVSLRSIELAVSHKWKSIIWFSCLKSFYRYSVHHWTCYILSFELEMNCKIFNQKWSISMIKYWQRLKSKTIMIEENMLVLENSSHIHCLETIRAYKYVV